MGLWKITSDRPVKVSETSFRAENLLERHLEDWIVADSSLLNDRLLIIGRQVLIPDVKDRLDLLAIDPQGNTVVIELKRGQLKDPVDIQALRYASYISKWQFEDFEKQAISFLGKSTDPEFRFNEFYEQFCLDAGVDEIPDLNSDQRIIIVGTEVKSRLGSVALWLRDHGVDIKIVEIDAYQENGSIFIQPKVIIPLPVSKFKEIGRASGGDVSRPWITDGKSWHLEKRCSPVTKKMLLSLDSIIRENFDVEGPRWNQKYYVAYRLGNYNWIAITTRASVLRLTINIDADAFDSTELATRLGVEKFDKEEPLAEKLGLPSSVHVQNRTEATDRIYLRLKQDFDLDSETFMSFLQDAYEAFPR